MEGEENSDHQSSSSNLEGAVGFNFGSYNNPTNYFNDNPIVSCSSSFPPSGSSGSGMYENSVKKRQSYCSLCSNHNFIVSKKGHKHFCPYNDCQCEKCEITKFRQEYVRKRQQKKRKQGPLFPADFPVDSKHSFTSQSSSFRENLTRDYPQKLQQEMERDLAELEDDNVIDEFGFRKGRSTSQSSCEPNEKNL
ncbi:UNVERIFIED_CONTAM: hypothetical protein RMT77_005831 [Armadillidium vulgare]